MMPKISVLIPCYNYAHFLPECLESVRSQTFPDWEAIVVDDASTRGNAAAVVSSVNDDRVRCIRNRENRGLGATLNIAFAAATASWVVILSADDLFATTLLEAAWEIISVDSAVDVVFSDLQLFGNSTSRWRYSVYDAERMTRGQWLPGAGAVMRRSVWERTGGNYEGPELRHGNIDWDFWLGAMKEGITVRHIPEGLYLYRIHGPSTTTTRNRNCHITHECIYSRHRDIFDRYGTGTHFRAEGYLHAARSSYLAGEKLRALLLAAKAWRIEETMPEPPFPPATGIERNRLEHTHRQLSDKIVRIADGCTAHTEENLDLRFILGAVALELGLHDEALEHLLISAGIHIRLAPLSENLARTISLIGEACRRAGKTESAIDAWELALRLAPSDVAACRGIVSLMLEQQRLSDALNVVLRSLDVEAASPAASINTPFLVLLGRIAADALGATCPDVLMRIQQEILAAERPSELAKPPSTHDEIQEILYHSEIGRKIWWNYRARDLYDTYGHQEGGHDTLEWAIQRVKPRRLLEIGCGNGRNFPLYNSLDVPVIVGQDINEAALELAASRGYSRIKLHRDPVRELPYPDGFFDLIVSNRVLQHIPPGEVEAVVAASCKLGNNVYLNEMTTEEMTAAKIAKTAFNLFVHDYDLLFMENGFSILDRKTVDGQVRCHYQKV